MAAKQLLDEVANLPNNQSQRERNLRAEVKLLEERAEQAEKRLYDLKQSRFALPTSKPTSAKTRGTYLRLYIPDTHGANVDTAAFAAMVNDLKQIGQGVREVIWLGDHMDCGSFLDERHTIGYVSQTDYTVAEDEDAVNQQLDQVQKYTPHAKHYYLEGNHEWRIEREIVGRCKGNRREIERQLSRNGPPAIMFLEKRGIQFFARGVKHMGLSVPGVIKVGQYGYATHGKTTAMNAAKVIAKRYCANVKFAHTHRAEMAIVQTVAGGLHSAWNFGCLARDNPVWGNGECTDWSHGYGLDVVNTNTEFLTLHVPIISGQSLLKLLAAKLGAS